MSLSLFAILSFAAFVSAFIQGALGIGFALIIAPVLGFLRPDLLPVTLLLLMLPLNFHVALRERAAIDWTGVKWITLGRFAGTFAGVWLLATLSTKHMDLAVGWFTVIAAAAALVAPPVRTGTCKLNRRWRVHRRYRDGNRHRWAAARSSLPTRPRGGPAINRGHMLFSG